MLREGPLDVADDLEAMAGERTVRGQFVRDVRADPALDEDTRRRVLRTGLRALDGPAEPTAARPPQRRGAAVRIESVTAHAFGPLTGETLELAPGLTVVAGVNESAKSSWHAALYAALCGRGQGRATPADRRLSSATNRGTTRRGCSRRCSCSTTGAGSRSARTSTAPNETGRVAAG